MISYEADFLGEFSWTCKALHDSTSNGRTVKGWKISRDEPAGFNATLVGSGGEDPALNKPLFPNFPLSRIWIF